jgi:hypothetical protein
VRTHRAGPKFFARDRLVAVAATVKEPSGTVPGCMEAVLRAPSGPARASGLNWAIQRETSVSETSRTAFPLP